MWDDVLLIGWSLFAVPNSDLQYVPKKTGISRFEYKGLNLKQKK